MTRAAPQARELDEDTLVGRAQDGDVDAFEELVTRYEARLYRYAYGMLGNRHDAEDVVQNTLIRVWRALPSLTIRGAFGGWVYRIASRRCLDLLQQSATRRTDARAPEELPESAEAAHAIGPPPPADPAQVAEKQGQLDELARLVQLLPPEQRACWLLREVQGRSYIEIAQALSVTESTVRGRLVRARARLAEGMQSWQ